ncbi:polysaccharide pyruvyl transferase CsaB [Pontibacillus yanchengensis]|uniref:Polysaccharide pyruvyl transferase CsaB n=2 Tax=Pontibacillus yanchengensis TaxID=462910 RepID=A0ACC7VG20_9BACI|nr:polysaccharide pyruvyl transferase CsaB [Pontibacillus yanchengensis]MYL34261.1 polysaccharide pyruvyl transferase CsaB [Pontibacillus yanchengensis]MYL53732.1 polysaccharide pyruvyl transferase CsaB [Pontibacillus yanchengensis]
MKLVISGFYGLGNTGDEAILDAMVDNLRTSLDEPDITVFSLSPEQTASKHNVNSIYRGWRHDFKKKVHALREADLVLSGGGGLLQDTYPTRIIFGPLPYYLLIVFLAKLCGTKVMFFSQGIGPVTTPYGKLLMRLFGNMADFITVRDEYSKKYLEQRHVTRPETVVTADIVFAYQSKRDTTCIESLPLSGEEKLVGVSVRPWFEETAYQTEMAQLLDQFMEEKGITPVFIPMEGDHDANVSRTIQGLMQHGDQTLVLGSDFSPNQYLQFIRECEMVIGMRLHALIFSTLASVPFVAISYDKKVESLAMRTGMWHHSTTLEDFTAASMYANVVDVYEHLETLGEQLDEERAELRDEALRNLTLLKEKFDRKAQAPV